MMKLFIEVTYPLDPTEKPTIRTNVKKERVSDLITDWLRTEMGKGSDGRKPVDLDTYHISLEIDLTDDSFRIYREDTGNSGLTTGIMMDIISKIKSKNVLWKG